jgi:hypothetical protein
MKVKDLIKKKVENGRVINVTAMGETINGSST